MSLQQIILLGSIFIPAFSAIVILLFFLNNERRAKEIAYEAFIFPFAAGIILFLNFDPLNDGYSHEILFERMGLHELGITFHLGLNGVSAPLFAMEERECLPV